MKNLLASLLGPNIYPIDSYQYRPLDLKRKAINPKYNNAPAAGTSTAPGPALDNPSVGYAEPKAILKRTMKIPHPIKTPINVPTALEQLQLTPTWQADTAPQGPRVALHSAPLGGKLCS